MIQSTISIKNAKKLKPIFQYKPNSSNLNFSKTSYSLGKSLVNNISLTNENRKLHDRINQKSSIYSVSKMDEQYKKSLEYKKNLCQFTSIDFGYIVRKSQKVKAKKKTFYKVLGIIIIFITPLGLSLLQLLMQYPKKAKVILLKITEIVKIVQIKDKF